jgi:hypothetical protein
MPRVRKAPGGQGASLWAVTSRLLGGCRGALRVNVTGRHGPSRPLPGEDRARPVHAKRGAEPPAGVLTALRHAPFTIA